MNPYDVLGVKPGATQDEIKTAYRKLVKKYHPDQYKGTDFEAKANEKLKEINEAYDILKNGGTSKTYNTGNGYSNRGTGYTGYNTGYNTGYGQYGTGGMTFEQLLAAVRQYISAGRYMEAELILRSTNMRSAEWYFLMGNVQWFKGWQLEARKCYAQAMQLDPNNVEYKAAYDRVNASAGRGQSGGYGYGYRQPNSRRQTEDDLCDCCCKLWALDTCCECMGVDCISCF